MTLLPVQPTERHGPNEEIDSALGATPTNKRGFDAGLSLPQVYNCQVPCRLGIMSAQCSLRRSCVLNIELRLSSLADCFHAVRMGRNEEAPTILAPLSWPFEANVSVEANNYLV